MCRDSARRRRSCWLAACSILAGSTTLIARAERRRVLLPSPRPCRGSGRLRSRSRVRRSDANGVRRGSRAASSVAARTARRGSRGCRRSPPPARRVRARVGASPRLRVGRHEHDVAGRGRCSWRRRADSCGAALSAQGSRHNSNTVGSFIAGISIRTGHRGCWTCSGVVPGNGTHRRHAHSVLTLLIRRRRCEDAPCASVTGGRGPNLLPVH